MQATSPWTLLEAGYNFNHTKDLLRLLRDRGALAGAALESPCRPSSPQVTHMWAQSRVFLGSTHSQHHRYSVRGRNYAV